MMDAELALYLAEWAKDLEPFPDPRFPPSVYYRFFRLLAIELRPSLSVELGVCGGGASFHMALGWPAGTVVGVEHSDGEKGQQENWAYMKSVCPNFHLWKGDSVGSAGEVARAHGKVDVLFIDTVHTYERTMAEWEAWEPHMAEHSVVCLDDLYRVGMSQAWKDVPWPNKIRLDGLHCGTPGQGGGFGMVWR